MHSNNQIMKREAMKVYLKRAYDPIEPKDGFRVLVDRLWPRGVRKDALSIDEWAKDVAPSTDARKAFGHKPENFDTFRARYVMELDNNPAAQAFAERMSRMENVTLVTGAKDRQINHAVVLADWLMEKTRLS